jgi:hypothetical protein
MATDNYPDKPLQPWVPRSMRDSGVNLDDGCNLSQAEAGEGFDKAVARLEKVKP